MKPHVATLSPEACATCKEREAKRETSVDALQTTAADSGLVIVGPGMVQYAYYNRNPILCTFGDYSGPY